MLYYMHSLLCVKEELWPDHLQSSPIQGHGLWSFYQGLRLGMQLTDACLEKI